MAYKEDEVSLTASREAINFRARGKIGITAMVLIIALVAFFMLQNLPS
jgi:hypothetical protein